MTRNKLRILTLIAWLFTVAGAAVAQSNVTHELLAGSPSTPASQSPAASKAVAPEYQIGPGDVLAINVWKEPELSRVQPVRPDGHLSLPLIGEVEVTGVTAAQLQVTLTEGYRRFMENPVVVVMVQEPRSKRFNVVGQVQKPGSLVLSQPTTVLDALALVGGPRDFANLKKIYVLRTHPD